MASIRWRCQRSETGIANLELARLGGATGVKSVRSGFRSSSGVPSRQSIPQTSNTVPLTPANVTIEVAIGFSLTGVRNENVPRAMPSLAVLRRTKSRRDRCGQYGTSIRS